MRYVVALVVVMATSWFVFLSALAFARPRGVRLADVRGLVPDTVRLLRDLSRDTSLPKGVRRRVLFVLAYLAVPIDLVPDFIPVLGYADDVIVVVFVLRSVVRVAGPAAVDRHWRGDPEGAATIKALCGV